MIRKILLILILLVCLSNSGSASISFDGNVIQISSIETLTTVNSTLDNSSLIEQLDTKEWLLKVPINIQTTGTLYINNTDTNWLKLSSLNNDNPAYINIVGTAIFDDVNISGWNSTVNTYPPDSDSNRSYIKVNGINSSFKSIDTDYSYIGYTGQQGIHMYNVGIDANITNSIFTNVSGVLSSRSTAISPTIVYTNISNVKGFLVDGRYFGANGTVLNTISMTSGSIISNVNNISLLNIHETGTTTHNGITFSSTDNCILKDSSVEGSLVDHNAVELSISNNDGYYGIVNNNSFVNVSVTNFVTGNNPFYFSQTNPGTDYNMTINNTVIENCSVHGSTLSTGLFLDFVNGVTIRNFIGTNIDYYDITFNYPTKNVWIIDFVDDNNLTHDGVYIHGDDINAINGDFTTGLASSDIGNIKEWYYLDIKVVDENGIPIEDATVNVASSNYSAKNMHSDAREGTEYGYFNGQNITGSVTGADGHTPLPSDSENAIIIMLHKGYRLVSSGTFLHEYPVWNINVSKIGYSSNHTVTITEDSAYRSRHRSNPDSYQNTTIIMLTTTWEFDQNKTYYKHDSPITQTIYSDGSSEYLYIQPDATYTELPFKVVCS